MESVSSTILTLLVTSTILHVGSPRRGFGADDDTGSDYGGHYGQRGCKDICEPGFVPVDISGLSCSRGRWFKYGTNIPTQDIECQELPPFNVVNVSTPADSITLWGRFKSCPNSSADKLNVWLRCKWYESHNSRCKSGTEVISQSHPYCSSALHNWTCQNLRPFSRYDIQLFVNYSLPSSGSSGFGYSQRQMQTFEKPLHTSRVNTSQAVPDKPWLLTVDVVKGRISWDLPNSCRAQVLGSQITIVGSRAHNASFPSEHVFTFDTSTTQLKNYTFICATKYNIILQADSSVGLGNKEEVIRMTAAKEPLVPEIQSRVSEITGSTARIQFTHSHRECTAVSFYEVIVSSTSYDSPSNRESLCQNRHLLAFQVNHPFNDYISLRIPTANVSGTMTLTIGDDQTIGNFWNRRLESDQQYTVTLRVVSDWSPEVKFVCAYYEPFYVSSGKVAATVTVLFFISLISILVVFLVYRRRQKQPRQAREQMVRPLIRKKSVMKSEINVSDLLKFLMKMRLLDEESSGEDDNTDELAKQFRNLSNYPLHACTVAKEPQNTSKNRYATILPYDNSRVVLKGRSNGYINASYIDGFRRQSHYIAAQGPLEETVDEFWHMVWQEGSSRIVMLTRVSEQGKCKCERYWPKEGSQTFGEFTITKISATSPRSKEFTIRILELHKAGTAPGSARKIHQFQYLQWPDHGTPRNPIGIYRLLKAVSQIDHHTGPLIIHCSAGVGRTGTFIAIDYLLKMAEEESKVDVFQCVDRLRGKRPGMVQTLEQYRFIYFVLLEAQLFGDTAIPVPQFQECLGTLIEKSGRPGASCKREFETLQTYSQLFSSHRHTEALQMCNITKNRCSKILPAEHVRPSLLSVKNPNGSAGYINAVFAERHGLRDRFILTQLPLSHTLADFWALVYDQNSTSIVNLNCLKGLDESYVLFWPEEGTANYGPFQVEMQSVTVCTDVTERLLILRKLGQKSAHEVKVLQLNSWPMGESVPRSPQPIINIDQRVQTWQKQGQLSPVVVTCWDGASRCGLYCTVSNICQQIRQFQLVDVFHCAKTTRSSRPQAVISLDQYSFCYQVAQAYLEKDRHAASADNGAAGGPAIIDQDIEDML
ncbi:receptor-type tyrosine-protein phosphatase alpha-like isoform X2 [Mobula hypostoma]|uniref:receptor-type tyrosine-protein phosphatase alpha-like isoform X2 n=1 Tax=Mobula hypostoma TaxID=723540 RepID=UPI002FC2D1B1